MPEFEFLGDIYNEGGNLIGHRVLVSVRSGKSYLSDPDQVKPQPAQHGYSCGYSAYGYLRVHYGKFFPEIAKRKQEKILADFSKKMGEFSKARKIQKAEIEPILKARKITDIDKNNVQEILDITNTAISIGNQENTAILNRIKNLLTVFSHSGFVALKSLIADQEAQTIIKICQDTLKALNIDPEEMAGIIYSTIEEPYSKIPFNQIPFGEKCVYYECAVRDAMRAAYGLSVSDWKKSQANQPNVQSSGIVGLINALKMYGLHEVGINFNSLDSSEKQKYYAGKLESWTMYDIPDDDLARFNLESDSHSVVIVGAEINLAESYVYFLDVNYELSEKNRELYRITYRSFEKHLLNIYDRGNELGPFLVHGNPEHIKSLEDFCRGIPALRSEQKESTKEEEDDEVKVPTVNF